MAREFNSIIHAYPVLALRALASTNGVQIPPRATYVELRPRVMAAEVKIPDDWSQEDLVVDADALAALKRFLQKSRANLVQLCRNHGLSIRGTPTKRVLACMLLNSNVWPNEEAVPAAQQPQLDVAQPQLDVAPSVVQVPSVVQQVQVPSVVQQAHPPPPPASNQQGQYVWVPAEPPYQPQPSPAQFQQQVVQPQQQVTATQLQQPQATVMTPDHKPWSTLSKRVQTGLSTEPFFFFSLASVRVPLRAEATVAKIGFASGNMLLEAFSELNNATHRFTSQWEVYKAYMSGAHLVASHFSWRSKDLLAYASLFFDRCLLGVPVASLVDWDARIRTRAADLKCTFMQCVMQAETGLMVALATMRAVERRSPRTGAPSSSSSPSSKRRKGSSSCNHFNAKVDCPRIPCRKPHTCCWCNSPSHARVDCNDPRLPATLPHSVARLLGQKK